MGLAPPTSTHHAEFISAPPPYMGSRNKFGMTLRFV